MTLNEIEKFIDESSDELILEQVTPELIWKYTKKLSEKSRSKLKIINERRFNDSIDNIIDVIKDGKYENL